MQNLQADLATWRRDVLLDSVVPNPIVPPDTSWQSLPASIDAAIFTGGGPAEWQGPGQGVSVIRVAANSRAGLPVRAVVQALGGASIDRTDRLGTVELLAEGGHFRPGS